MDIMGDKLTLSYFFLDKRYTDYLKPDGTYNDLKIDCRKHGIKLLRWFWETRVMMHYI